MTRRRALAPALGAAALALGATGAIAQNDPRIVEDTGRDTRVWPPDVLFDSLHMRLEMDFPDVSTSAFDAVETLELTPIGVARDTVRLDASDALRVASVTLDAKPLSFDHADNELSITLPRAFNPGEPVTLVITYSTDDPGGRGEGLTHSDDDRRTPETDYLFHAQGEPEANHLWFPCHDFPNDRLTVELIVSVPPPYEAISNGRLLTISKSTERNTYHWSQDLPHVNYLTTLVIGRFDVVNIGGPDSARPGMWMPVYGPIGSAGALRRNFAKTAEMLAFLEERFDEPYPWDKYANLVVRDFAAGAMENTGTVTFGAFVTQVPASMADGINVHEMTHHWFGDLMTCRTWEHLWLNEGWAAYGECLWAEHQGGPEAYLDAVLANARGRGGQLYNHVPEPRTPAMASNRYNKPDDRFTIRNNVYAKGPIVIHMLRRRLGDDAFWKGVHNYIDTYKYTEVETEDFRKALEDASGIDLELFFDQWVYRPMTPRLDVAFEYHAGADSLDIAYEQTQTIDELNPAFIFDLPVRLEFADGSARTIKVRVDQRNATITVPVDAEPTQAGVNPDFDVLVRTDITKPLAWWIDELRHPATTYAASQAQEFLRQSPDPEAARALGELGLTDAPANAHAE